MSPTGVPSIASIGPTCSLPCFIFKTFTREAQWIGPILAIESKILLRSLTSDLWNYSLRPQPTQLRRIDFLIVNLSLLFMPAFSAARILRRSTK